MRRKAIFLTLLCSCLAVAPAHPFNLHASQDVIILPDPGHEEFQSDPMSYDRLSSSFDDSGIPVSDDDSSDLSSADDPDTSLAESELISDDLSGTVFEDGYDIDYDRTGETETESESACSDDIGSSGTDAVLVIDVSGSMVHSDPDYLCKKAALDFIHSLAGEGTSRVALVTFSDTIVTDIPLTVIDSEDASGVVTDAIDQLTYTKGDTDIGTAMQEASRILAEDRNDTRARSIFLLTDGEIDLPQAEDEEAAEKDSLTRALVAVEDAKETGTVIHTITLDLSGGVDTNLMNYMADSTGGTASHVNDPAGLSEVFEKLTEYARQQARELYLEEAMTETETEAKTEAETETETETESETIPVVHTSGTINGPVKLKGLLPNMCEAELDLNNLFYMEGGEDIIYTAYADDESLLDCSVENGILNLTGIQNGTSRVHVYAEPPLLEPGNEQQAMLTFLVSVDAIIPSPLYLLSIPALGLVISLIILLHRRRDTGDIPLSGTLQWYVRGENEKIFGIPGQLYADLSEYGSKVLLSELVQDELVADTDLHKVSICAIEDGIRITSKSRDCLVQAAGSDPERSIELEASGRFKILCETARGQAIIIAFYAFDREIIKEPSYADDSDERTRMLI